jgi:amino acid adenylation domain-containing protein/non-ribosomal peptide synthase protein (TIGR01720 family)
VEDGRELTYGELNARADRLAGWLRAAGVGREDRVGVFGRRGTGMLVTILGVLKAGAAWVPLDPRDPAERLRTVVEAAGLKCLAAGGGELAALAAALVEGPDCRVFDWELPIEGEETEPPPWAEGHDLAYVFYTSGSTGAPKGVMVERLGMLNHLEAKLSLLGLGEGDVVIQNASHCFDISVWQFLAALMAGGRVVICGDETAADPERLIAAVREQRASVLETVPSFLDLLLRLPAAREGLATVRWLISNAETLSVPLARRWFEVGGGRLVNTYGATECGDDVTHAVMEAAPAGDLARVGVGRPIAGSRVYVLDDERRLAPIGAAGEIAIGAACVGRGYLADPATTAASFVPDPFGEAAGERLYLTGDVGRWRADGVLEFLGRRDGQVKVRGHRIEVGEVEGVLSALPGVSQAAVAVKGGRLIGYWVGENGHAVGDVRPKVAAKLPAYMVPDTFVRVDRLPLTRSGKIDRRALPDPEAGGGRAEYVAPRTPLEQRIAAVWAEVLGVDRVGLLDNFFDRGGDSIQSILVVSRLRELGIRITPKAFFKHRTVAELARAAETDEGPPRDDGPVAGAVPLLPAQRAFLETRANPGDYWNIAFMLGGEELREEPLRQALQAVLDHHDALRMRFARSEQGWTQQSAPSGGAVAFDVLDLGAPDGLEAAASRVQASIDPVRGPVFRAVLFRCGAAGDRLLLVTDHLVSDGVSTRILVEDLRRAYAQVLAGEPIRLPPPTTAYSRWAAALAAHGDKAVEAELPYWRSVLAQSAAALPVDHDRGPNHQASAAVVPVTLEASWTRRLRAEAPRVYGADLNELLLTALGRALGAWTERDAVAVHVQGHGREELFDADLTRTVGLFLSFHPLPLPTGRGIGPAAHAALVREQLARVPNHGIGYGIVRERVGGAETEPQVTFNHTGQFTTTLAPGALALARESAGRGRSAGCRRPALLEVECAIAGDRLHVAFTYSRNRHRARTIQRLARMFLAELLALAAGGVDGAVRVPAARLKRRARSTAEARA